MSFYRCLKKLPPAPVLWQLPESHLIAAWKHMKWFHVYVCLVEGTRLLHACRYKGRERKYRWKCSFQDICFFRLATILPPLLQLELLLKKTLYLQLFLMHKWIAANLTLKACQPLVHWLTTQLPLTLPRTSAGRPTLVKYVTVILFIIKIIPNSSVTRS